MKANTLKDQINLKHKTMLLYLVNLLMITSNEFQFNRGQNAITFRVVRVIYL